MDSGGFTMLLNHGRFVLSESDYLECLARHNPPRAFCQDWMCEPFILEKTGLTVRDHQERTLASYLSLSSIDNRISPVLQGWTPSDYAVHADMYQREGVDMSQVFGLGTVCSRNGSSNTICWILNSIKQVAPEIKLHGFGVKTTTLSTLHHMFESADSMAWSARGRRDKLCNWCGKRSCGHCLEYALLWRKKILSQLSPELKQSLPIFDNQEVANAG